MRWPIVALFACAACGGADPPPPVPVPIATVSSTAPPPPPVASGTPCPVVATDDSKPDLPAVPTLPVTPKKDGEAYTVFGATHDLRSRFASADIQKSEITIVGYIVDSNVQRAPKCAWHKTGVADPANCVTETPTFVIADAKDAKADDPAIPHIKVLGWARNFAIVFDATAKYKGLTAAPTTLVKDDIWAVDVPYPIPARGTKVKVKGNYGFSFTKSSSGMVTDPNNGILTYTSLQTVP
jgi:hypothetical protein